jgi:ABC-type branched-subunit amino acid transport system ATPase component
MLYVKDIKKSFGGVQAIQGSTFDVEQGRITALIGPNGAGKTTLFDIICGLVTPSSGSVSFCGEELVGRESFDIANKGISRTFQQVRLFKYLRIIDHLRMADDNDDTRFFFNLVASSGCDKSPYNEVIKEFGIERSVHTVVSDLSYGQRKLLDLAMAIRRAHNMLLFDEPVAGVNAVVQERIEHILLDLKKKGETMLIIDHDMSFIRRLADHVVVLDAGVVLTQGTPGVVLQDPRVLEAYLGK